MNNSKKTKRESIYKKKLKVGSRCNNNCSFCSYLDIKGNSEKTLASIKKEILLNVVLNLQQIVLILF